MQYIYSWIKEFDLTQERSRNYIKQGDFTKIHCYVNLAQQICLQFVTIKGFIKMLLENRAEELCQEANFWESETSCHRAWAQIYFEINKEPPWCKSIWTGGGRAAKWQPTQTCLRSNDYTQRDCRWIQEETGAMGSDIPSQPAAAGAVLHLLSEPHGHAPCHQL